MHRTDTPAPLNGGRSSDFIIHVYSFDQLVLQGCIKHVQSGRSMQVGSTLEMIFMLEQWLNQMGCPQPGMALRSWTKANEHAPFNTSELGCPLLPAEDLMPDQILATFLLRIQFRQNASWQGTLKWLEMKQRCSFRSVLELLNLICQALCPVLADPGPTFSGATSQPERIHGDS